MWGLLTTIGGAIAKVGGAILNGLKFVWNNVLKPIGGFIKKVATDVWDWGKNFVKNVGSKIKEGWDWLTKPVKEMMGGDTAKAAEAFKESAGAGAVPHPDGRLESAFMDDYYSGMKETISGKIGSGVSKATTEAVTGGLNTSVTNAGKAASTNVNKAVETAANTGGDWKMTPLGATKTKEGIGGLFDSAMGWFSTPIGQMVGEGGMSLLAKKMEKDATREEIKAMEAEARRQEAQKQQDWLMEQNRQNQINQFQLDYQNKAARANSNNRWAGFTGEWQQPDTTMPAPQVGGMM